MRLGEKKKLHGGRDHELFSGLKISTAGLSKKHAVRALDQAPPSLENHATKQQS